LLLVSRRKSEPSLLLPRKKRFGLVKYPYLRIGARYFSFEGFGDTVTLRSNPTLDSSGPLAYRTFEFVVSSLETIFLGRDVVVFFFFFFFFFLIFFSRSFLFFSCSCLSQSFFFCCCYYPTINAQSCCRIMVES